jgi:DNA-binding CsgD family transcriptional regulator
VTIAISIAFLAPNDMQQIHQCIQQLYRLRDLDTFGTRALSIINQIVPCDLPVFHLTRVRSQQIFSTFLPNFTDLTPEIAATIDRCCGKQPIVHSIPYIHRQIDRALNEISRKQLYCLEALDLQLLRFLNIEDRMTFFLPNINSLRWGKISPPDSTLIGFSLNRIQHRFTHEDRLELNLLRPHLFQAYCNLRQHRALQQDFHRLQKSIDALGIIILDRRGRIRSIAPQAESWLKNYFSPSTNVNRLPDLLWSWTQHQIDIHTKSNPPPACSPLRSQQSDRELVIRLVIQPDRSGYLLLMEEQALSSLNSIDILGLSDRETAVIGLVMQGLDNKSIASQLAVNISTVRKHLENAYRKLGVNSRTEAISQILEIMGIVHFK